MADKSQTYAEAFLRAISSGQDEDVARNISRRFLGVLKRKRELYLLPKILKCIKKLLVKEDGTLVTSRFALDAGVREQLAVFLKKTFADFNESRMAFKISENALGGISVRHKDFLYDATLDSSLGKLKATWE